MSILLSIALIAIIMFALVVVLSVCAMLIIDHYKEQNPIVSIVYEDVV